MRDNAGVPEPLSDHKPHFLEHSEMQAMFCSEQEDGLIFDLLAERTIILRMYPNGEFAAIAERPQRPVSVLLPEDDEVIRLVRKWAEDGVMLTVEVVRNETEYIRIAMEDSQGQGWMRGKHPYRK